MGREKTIAVQMDEILDHVKNTVDEDIEKSSDAAAKVARSNLKENSPKDKGDYAKGWRIKKDKKAKTTIVHNSKYPGLTHLLENGHIVKNAKGIVGRAAGVKHIEPAAEEGAAEFVESAEKGLNRL